MSHQLVTIVRWTFIAMTFTTFAMTLGLRSFVTVNTRSGPIKGETIDVLGKKVNRFWGIPYAEPPLGKIRFKPTSTVKPWTDTLEALDRPNSCYQVIDEMFNKFRGVDMWNPNTPMSEDCLMLNIYAPVTPHKNLTTMVWIFGGSFNAGTATLDVYDPRYLAAENNVIVVTLNYRFGPFGFLFFEHEDAPGNIGLLDQRLAFKWLYDNIDVFNGDKSKISLFGESSGAASISLHLLSQKSWPYFNNAILQSGAFGAHWAFQTKDEALRRAHKLAALVGCNKTKTAQVIECLRGVDATTLANKQWSVPNSKYYFDITFGPTIDGDFLSESPDVLARRNAFKNTNLLAGVNSNEGAYFLMYGMPNVFPNPAPTADISDKTLAESLGTILEPVGNTNNRVDTVTFSYKDSLIPPERPQNRDIVENFAGDLSFKCPTLDFSRQFTMSRGDVFVYHYAHRSSFNPWPKYAGVMHGYEIDIVFGLPLNDSIDVNYTTDEKALSREMMRLWTNFAKTGNPNKDSPLSNAADTWPKFDNSSQYYYLIKTKGRVSKQWLRHRQCTLISSLLPKFDDKPDNEYNCVVTGAPGGSGPSLITTATTVAFMLLHQLYTVT